MISRKVLDSYAVIAFLENETGADKIAALIKHARDSENPLLLCVVNWGEVYYILHKTVGKDAARQALQSIDTLPIEIIPADRDLTLIAAELKARYKMSYADCFAAALAKSKKAEIVTGDKEFEQIESEIKIIWL
ncbi:MAG: type II toxin-antitoxin system VapC family toxin [Candidatus Aureabacteria bacterium]|nr:type II toxin-antitoxin system VapC family toxin [Candidatus Auribacterota bacterium]